MVVKLVPHLLDMFVFDHLDMFAVRLRMNSISKLEDQKRFDILIFDPTTNESPKADSQNPTTNRKYDCL